MVKISSYTQLLVMFCLVAGLAMYVAVNSKFDQLDQASNQQQVLQNAKSDVDVIQTMLSQWYTTIDLYYTDHQTYFAKGISSQTGQLLKRFVLLEKAAGHLPQLTQLQQRITVEAEQINDIAFKPATDEQLWSTQLAQSDRNTQQISQLFESLNARLEKQHQQALEHAQTQRTELQQQAILLLIGYIALLVGAAYWTSRTIIKPLQKLTEITAKNPNTYNMANLQLTKGPKEVQQLSNSFHNLYQRIASEVEQALDAKAAEKRAKDRLRALVNNVSLSIITVDIQGFISTCNPATPELFGLTNEQLDGRQITELLPALNINGGLFKQMLNAGVDIELDAIVGEKRKPVELSCAEFSFVHEQQTIRQYTLILHDISHRKRNEDRVRKLNQRLINTSRQAGIAEIATSILHSIGNVLNSVNTSVAMLGQALSQNKIEGVKKAAEMLKTQGAELFETDGKGPQLIEYLEAVAQQLEQGKDDSLGEVNALKQNVNHIAEIVSAQQKFSGKSGVIERLNIGELFEEALNINVVSLENNQIAVERNLVAPLEIMGDRSKIIQILVNLVRNASEAVIVPTTHVAKIELSAEIIEHNVILKVKDNGQGISEENMAQMFRYGFTTKEDGHGFGLHSCALAAKEMRGSLTVTSEGNGLGALFCLTLPTDPANQESRDIQSLIEAKAEKSNG